MTCEITTVYSNGGVRYEAVPVEEPISKEPFLPARFARSPLIKGEGASAREAIRDLEAKLKETGRMRGEP